MTTDNLRADVVAELSWDPQVDSTRIAVSTEDGRVTLRGPVSSVRQKRAAQRAARRVHGVTDVGSYLEVQVSDQDRRTDAELQADVLQAFTLNSFIPATVGARAAGGVVTLSGTAIWQHQRDEAESICASVSGVLAVEDEISLNPEPADGDIARGVSASYRRSARLSRYGLSVDSPYHHVLIVSGAVSSWAEHDDALGAAWSAPGVTDVYDRVVVLY
jgi:osmotically-inducible protein OsmY